MESKVTLKELVGTKIIYALVGAIVLLTIIRFIIFCIMDSRGI